MNNISWDKYFMSLAKVSAMRSKDPNTKVGATLVNKKLRVIGLGYNGMPNGNDNFPWVRDGEFKDTKYPYVVHAEMNAILNSTQSVEGSKLYVSLFPCSTCSKLCVQAGVKEIIFEEDKYNNTEDDVIAKKILNDSGVSFRKLKSFKLNVE